MESVYRPYYPYFVEGNLCHPAFFELFLHRDCVSFILRRSVRRAYFVIVLVNGVFGRSLHA